MFCRTCQCLTCRSCIVDTHNGHSFAPVNHATRVDVEKQVKELTDNAKQTLSKFQLYFDYTENVEKKKLNAPDKMRKEIESTFDSLVAAIRSRQQELLSQVKNESDQSFKEIWSQKERLETVITALKGTISFAERSLQCSHEARFLALCPQIIPRLGEFNGARWDSSSLERIDLTNKIFQCADLCTQISGYGVITDTSPNIKMPNLDIGQGMARGAFKFQQASPSYSAHGRYWVSPPGSACGLHQAPLNLPIKSLSDLELGKQVNVMLSLQLRPSMFQNISVTVTIQNPQLPSFGGFCPALQVTNQQSPTGSSLTHYISQFNEITVSFIPVISGEHQINVTSQGQTEAVRINILGKPKIGAAVKQGPHWSHQGLRLGRGLGPSVHKPRMFGSQHANRHDTVRGTISDNMKEGYVSVLWVGHTEPELHLWGHNGKYGVQLDL